MFTLTVDGMHVHVHLQADNETGRRQSVLTHAAPAPDDADSCVVKRRAYLRASHHR